MRRNIRKILFVALWCIVGAGLLVLLGAAIRSRNNKTCKGWKIGINSSADLPFVDKKEVLGLLTANGSEKLPGRAIMSFDLRRMEAALEKNAWISDAQLFFDNNQVLRVEVFEREPVARIFTTGGESFYMDSSGKQIPLSDKCTALLPVFTGYPSAKIRLHGADSALTRQIRDLSGYILKQPFWMSQLAQIAITPTQNFEMIPVVGNHLIEFGDGNGYEQKFHRLFVFYKEVLTRTGFDKYAKIDVRYEGQVIGTKKERLTSRYDSLLAIKNVQQLIRSAQQLQADTVSRQDTRPLERNTITEQTLTNYDLVPEKDENRSSPEPLSAAPTNRPAPLKGSSPLKNPAPVKKPRPVKTAVSLNSPSSAKRRTPIGNPIPVKNSGPMKNPSAPLKDPSAASPDQRPKALMPKKAPE